MKRKILILSLLLTQALFIGFKASASEPVWLNYSSTGHVKAMYENNGNMWVASLGGVVKYNIESGKKTYFSKAENGLPSNSVEDITSDLAGNIWIGTYDAGISMYDGTKWTNYNTANSKLPSNAVMAVEADKNGNIYIGTSNGLVVIKDNKWTVFNSRSTPSIGSIDIWSLALDDKNGLWIGTDFNVYYYKDSTFTAYGDSLPLYGVNDVEFSPSFGPIAVGNGGVFSLNMNTKTWKALATSEQVQGMSSAMYTKTDAENNLWVTSFNGVYKYDGKTWTSYEDTNPGSQVMALCLDKNGSLWGAGWNGINRFSKNEWQTLTPLNNTIAENYIRTITSDKKGTVWINGNRSITRYTKAGWEVFTTANSKLPSDFVRNVRIDKNGNPWFATDKGLAQYVDGNWIVFDTKSSALPDDNVSDVAFDKDGNIWAAHELGISIIDTKEWEQIQNPANFDENERFLTIVFDGAGNAWLSTSKGNIYKYANKNWQRYSFDDKTFAGGYVMDMKFDAKTNRIWAGTWGGGLNFFEENKWNEYTTGQPIIISAVLFDTKSNIWSSSIYPSTLKITKPDGESMLYDATNSPLPTTNINALEEDEEGNIWIGTDAGILVYQANESANVPSAKKINNVGLGKLYPNPASEKTNLVFTLGTKSAVQINITDVAGRIVNQLPVQLLPAGDQIIDLPTAGLPNGTYIVKLQADKLSVNYKLVISR